MISVGEILRKQRERLDIDLGEVEKDIKIRRKFLEAVERNDWKVFSSKVYISGIIKNYSNFLGLDPKINLAFFRRDYEKKESLRFKTRLAGTALAPESRKIIFGVLLVLIILFFGYFGYQLTLFFSPPGIKILSPNISAFKGVNKITVEAKTEKDATVTIFGDRIYQDKNGVFRYDFPLKKGNNELIIEVVGANGKKAVVKKNFTKND